MTYFTPNEKSQGTPLTEQTALVGEQAEVKMRSAARLAVSLERARPSLKGTRNSVAMRVITCTQKKKKERERRKQPEREMSRYESGSAFLAVNTISQEFVTVKKNKKKNQQEAPNLGTSENKARTAIKQFPLVTVAAASILEEKKRLRAIQDRRCTENAE